MQKPIIIGEAGVESPNAVPDNSGDYDALVQMVKANMPDVVAFVVWCQDHSLSHPNGGAVSGKATAFMNDAWSISLGDLPPF